MLKISTSGVSSMRNSTMYRIVKILSLLVWAIESESLTKYGSFDQVIQKILDLNASQTCIIRNEESIKVSDRFNLVFGKISSKIPTFMLDLNGTKTSNVSKKIENVRIGLRSPLYLILENLLDFNVQKTRNTLNTIAVLNSSPPRAKFLMILIGNSTSYEVDSNKLLAEAWDLKFLDFSILIVNSIGNSMILDYNPFFERFHRKNLATGGLFPDKLENMNGHKIRIPLYSKPPHVEFVNYSNEISIDGVNYGFIRLTSAALNFSLDYVKMNNDVSENYVFEKIEKGDLVTSIIPYTIGMQLAPLYERGVLIGKVVMEANMNLVGPIFNTNQQSKVYMKIIIYLSLTSLIILIVMVIVKFSKQTSSFWTPLNVLALLFGITVPDRPLKWFQKLVYVTLAMVSIKYSSDFFAVFTDDDVVTNNEIIFDALEEIKKPSLPLYLLNTYFQNDVYYEDEVIQNLKEHSVLINDSKECFEREVIIFMIGCAIAVLIFVFELISQIKSK